MDNNEKLKAIKRSFRLFMNGVTSQSMREKGLDYKINWGISQPDLRRIASSYDKDKELADMLWAEKIRECRMLATLLCPAEEMTVEKAVEWSASVDSIELAEFLAFNLFQHIQEADRLVKPLLDADNKCLHICAYHLATRLLKQRKQLDAEAYAALLGSAEADFRQADRHVVHAMVNCLDYITGSDSPYAEQTARLLKEFGLDAF